MKRMTKRNSTTANLPLLGLLMALSFIGLVGYRLLFHLPVWVDEIGAKALLFGLPVLLYAWWTRNDARFFGLDPHTFWYGAIYGLAVGGILSFIAMVASTIGKGSIFIPGLLSSSRFWYEFFLAFVTAWWESLFFYGLVQSVLQQKVKSEWNVALLTTGIFLVFHAPVLLLRSGVAQTIPALFLLLFFALGQAIVFLRTRSLASVVMSHAFWGMALLVYGGSR